MRTLCFPLFLLLTLLLACNSSDSEQKESNQEESISVQQLDQDSLQTLYKERIAAREDLLPAKQIPEAGKLNPVDEGQLDTIFFLFREDLFDAIAKRDVFFIMEMLDEDIKSSFGEDNGIPGFVRMWGLDSPAKAKESELWSVLKNTLELGGTFDSDKTHFTAPYVFSTFPDQYDAFEYGAIAGRGVRFREGPNLDSRIIKSISYDIVLIVGPTDHQETIGDETHPWIQVKLLDDTEGYVYGKFVRRPIDFRASFKRQASGEWKMVFLVAGD